ncbi:baseplate J/gp47 family protein [Streptomyces sp. NPDC088921]|uniref:baseplate J/gp47 family protein n=1 Tax=unclassified Streptomyces TaxID=2593676 RepID=UPI0034368701
MTPGHACPGGLPTTPLPVDNPPDRPVLRTRMGTFGSFRRTMLERIATHAQLAALTSRDPDDHAIALLEQWAALADVLTFYSERYANEAYLGTATRDDSVRRLVRLIGYRPRPGVSATTTLAFTFGDRAALTVPSGFAVQSVPGPGEEPQTFETLENCAGDWRLNTLPVVGPPRCCDPLTAPAGALIDPISAPQVAGQWRPGDAVVLVNQAGTGAVVRTTVATVAATEAGLRVRLGHLASGPHADAYRIRRGVRVFGHDAPTTAPPVAVPTPSAPGGVRWDFDRPIAAEIEAGEPLPLERGYEDLAVGTLLLAVVPEGFAQVVQVVKVTVATAEFAGRTASIAAVSTSPALPGIPDRRILQITELSGGKLPFLGKDHPNVLGNELWIPGTAEGGPADGRPADGVRVAGPPDSDPGQQPVIFPNDFPKGRRVVLTDRAGPVLITQVQGPTRREPAVAAPGTACHLVVSVTATADETAVLDATATRLLGNVAAASHGRTVSGEILGSGDASAAFQRFALAKGPLTRVPAATPEGSVPALTVQVSALAYDEVPELLTAGPLDEVYTLRTEADASTAVQLGDGVNGARARTGVNNVVASYRYGAGLAGRVGARSLTQPLTRLPGIEEVTNPMPARGGADSEDGSALRNRASGAVRVLARAVSADDCADVLIGTGQVAKAQSATLWDGRGLLIAVTAAAPQGGVIDPAGLRLLAKVISAAGPPYRRVVVVDHAPVPVTIGVAVTPEPRADADDVVASVRAALTDRLSFDRVTLARPLHLSDLYLALPGLAGVAAVNVTRFAFRRPADMDDAAWDVFVTAHGADGDSNGPGAVSAQLPERLRLLGTRSHGHGAVLPAELPTLSAHDLTVTTVSVPSAPATGGFA